MVGAVVVLVVVPFVVVAEISEEGDVRGLGTNWRIGGGITVSEIVVLGVVWWALGVFVVRGVVVGLVEVWC